MSKIDSDNDGIFDRFEEYVTATKLEQINDAKAIADNELWARGYQQIAKLEHQKVTNQRKTRKKKPAVYTLSVGW